MSWVGEIFAYDDLVTVVMDGSPYCFKPDTLEFCWGAQSQRGMGIPNITRTV